MIIRNELWSNKVKSLETCISQNGNFILVKDTWKTFCCFNLNNGNLQWKYKHKKELLRIIASEDGNFILSIDIKNMMRCFSKNGSIFWEKKMEEKLSPHTLEKIITTESGDMTLIAYRGWNNISLVAVGRKGDILWRYDSPKGDGFPIKSESYGPGGQVTYYNPIYISKVHGVIIIGFKKSIVALDLNGRSIWEFRDPRYKKTLRYLDLIIILRKDDSIFCISDNRNIICLNKHGQIKWVKMLRIPEKNDHIENIFVSENEDYFIIDSYYLPTLKHTLSCFDIKANFQWEEDISSLSRLSDMVSGGFRNLNISQNGDFFIASRGKDLKCFKIGNIFTEENPFRVGMNGSSPNPPHGYGPSQPSPMSHTYPCSACGYQLQWIQHYRQWWCPACRKYQGSGGPTQARPYHTGYQTQPIGQPCPTNPGGQPLQSTSVQGLSAAGYQGPRIIYKVKVENPGPEPICDIRVSVFFPKDVFLVDEQLKEISLLQPNESNTATFYLRPTGECGKRTLSAEIDFYDYGSACRKKVSVKPREVEVVCPVLSPMALDDSSWKALTQRLITSQDETNDIPINVEALSEIVFKALQEFNMAPMEQIKIQDEGLFHIINRFAAVGVKGHEYAARVEAVGGPRKARVLLACYADNDITLTGFHHAIIDIIEKRTRVKQYLTDDIIIQHIKGDYVVGDKITIKDSVIQRSKIG